MDLSQKNEVNLEYMIEEMKKKLKMASIGAIKPSHFDIDQYEDIRDLYEWVINKSNISIAEVEALVSELGKLRKL